MNRFEHRLSRTLSELALLMIVISVLVGCGEKKEPPRAIVEQASRPELPELSAEQKRIAQIVASEELILELSPKLKQLADHWNGKVDAFPTTIFEDDFSCAGLRPFELELNFDPDKPEFESLVKIHWPTSDEEPSSRSAEDLWRPFLNRYQIEDSGFGFLNGKFANDSVDSKVFFTETKFEGRFTERQSGGGAFGVKAKQRLTWFRQDSGAWQLGRWEQLSFDVVAANDKFFVDATTAAIPDKVTREIAQNNSHTKLLIETARAGNTGKRLRPPRLDYASFGDWASIYQYSAASVVDFDNDGRDDLYLSDRWGPSLLLRNEGNGKFKDVSHEVGLVIDELGSCALFADFDNDGDPDVLVCRVLEPCLYFENDEGFFRKDEDVCRRLKSVKFVVSGAVVDVNRDGLLDVYLSTYALGNQYQTDWIEKVVRKQDFLDTCLKVQAQHPYLDRAGPPNILLMNKGGRLRRVEIPDELKQWRTTFQSAWCDIDADGDHDLYVCNDFAKDAILRNDTPQGSFDIQFKDVSDEISPDGMMAYAMGASWGDFNNDGDLDLYVSNMYSKAGNRIVDQLELPDPRIGISAVGNFLYEKTGETFKQVAGTDDQDQRVSEVGWSFGGQFADFDNDGKLDIYVTSGNYTAPAELATKVDL